MIVRKTEKNKIVKPIRIPDRELMKAVSKTDRSLAKIEIIGKKVNNKFLMNEP